MDADSAIRSTDSDAAQARLSTVNKGYLTDDPFISFFVPRARFLPPRAPLINVGTFVRATAIDQLVHQWIEKNDVVQIVSLGAGSDTRFWRLSVNKLNLNFQLSILKAEFLQIILGARRLENHLRFATILK